MSRRDLYNDDGWWIGQVDVLAEDNVPSLLVQLGARVPGHQAPTTTLFPNAARRLAAILLAAAMEAEDRDR